MGTDEGEDEEEETAAGIVEKYFGDKVQKLREAHGLTAPCEFVYVATDTPFKYGLSRDNFTKGLQKLGIRFNNYDPYDRCIMLFLNGNATWGRKTEGGIITLDGIWWKDSDLNGSVPGFRWTEVKSIVLKSGLWKGDYLEINGQSVIIDALSDSFLGKENFANFFSAMSKCQVFQ